MDDLTTLSIIATIIGAVIGVIGVLSKVIFDILINKHKHALDEKILDKEANLKEDSAFKQEMRDELRVLRSEVNQLREENFQLRAQNSRLVLRISELEDELRIMRRLAGIDKNYDILPVEEDE
jgi:predicted nuclease with TOPRIM domain